MKFRVHEIQDAGGLDTTALIPAAEVVLDLPDHPVVVEPVAVQLQAEVLEDEILMTASAAAKVRLPCSRCLEGYVTALSSSFETHVPLKQTFIEVAEEVRQSLLLALPPKPLCRPDCRGLCQHCGKNLNQGPCGCPTERRQTPFEKLKDFNVH